MRFLPRGHPNPKYDLVLEFICISQPRLVWTEQSVHVKFEVTSSGGISQQLAHSRLARFPRDSKNEKVSPSGFCSPLHLTQGHSRR
ncbi:hypothetical protein SCLCIDRAFT_1096398 [Scleroderma citrinum Foug A]|uniref:Uncharacterized protein n=1 Tax=Scleroderma citrinum Foug A TaxID=1036808 RepID=A0A0C3DQW0_9AGAM|nr:hypothetical protein SCLCIDRAFT_1096398 [Scleroderma citrinum Foug A]